MATTLSFDSNFDLSLPFIVYGGSFRGRVVRLAATATEILARHNDPAPVGALLAEAMAAAVGLSTGLKYDGVFTLQIQSDGPVHMLVTDVTCDGGLRGCAKFDHDRLVSALRRKRPDGFNIRTLGTGHLAFTVDQGPDTERYQGIVELTEGSLVDAVHHYFHQSEQLDSALQNCSEEQRNGAGRCLDCRRGGAAAHARRGRGKRSGHDSGGKRRCVADRRHSFGESQRCRTSRSGAQTVAAASASLRDHGRRSSFAACGSCRMPLFAGTEHPCACFVSIK